MKISSAKVVVFLFEFTTSVDVSYFNLDRIVKWSLYSIFLIIYFICIVWMKERSA